MVSGSTAAETDTYLYLNGRQERVDKRLTSEKEREET